MTDSPAATTAGSTSRHRAHRRSREERSHRESRVRAARAGGCAPRLATVERNKEVARRAFSEILEKRRYELANVLYAPDFRNGKATLAEDMAALRALHAASPPDTTIRPDLLVGEGDYVTVLWTARATVDGRPMVERGITIWRFENGRIREEWSAYDEERLMRELGLSSPERSPVPR